MEDCKAVEYSSKSVCDYVAGQLGVGLQPSPDLRLEAAVGENLGDQAELTGLNRRQLLVEQQHLAGLKTGDSSCPLCPTSRYSRHISVTMVTVMFTNCDGFRSDGLNAVKCN